MDLIFKFIQKSILMANISLPAKFKEILERDQELDGIVKYTSAIFGQILEERNLYFFSEYTDHGIKHIQDVLFSSDNLITDDTYKSILGYKDIGYYILSVILHDIGMHIQLHGFVRLLEGDYDDVRIKELDELTWKEAWEEYLSEARKFSGKQLKAIFGDENTIVKTPPFETPGEINENDKKLVGEFIRRQHPRLAHEIALKGFPGKPQILEFASALDLNARNLLGLIARSHGTDLRVCLNYIELKYGRDNRRFPNGIHATYLMVLLRIADYIQIDSSRTSTATIKTKTFSSPVSEIEHQAHLAIDTVDYKWHDDPERIYVNATPKDSQMFLKLKTLFKNIQYEFDMSWAVLGELYGKREDEKPEIKYRRINSNLENKTFTEHQTYVADSFMFKTNEEIIKLMVAPLYGDDIKYGVRELLQNAVDACKERELIEKRKNQDYKPEITISILEEKKDKYFVISDNGIGMSADIIKNYLLSAGASYRKSLEWRKEFTEDNGKVLIRRSGRFGVGILSAFLIGDEILVQTKKIDSSLGYIFKAGLNTDQINIMKDTASHQGTSIKIKITNKKFEQFANYRKNKWHKWYTLASPSIKYIFLNKEIKSYSTLDPDVSTAIPDDWQSINSFGYDKILWTYSKKYAEPKFTCNGIDIPEVYSLDLKLIIATPKINVFDSNGILPLTLNRNKVSKNISFLEDLTKDIYKDFIAYFLMSDKLFINDKKIIPNPTFLNYPGFSSSYLPLKSEYYGINCYNHKYHMLQYFVSKLLISKKGFILNYNYFLQRIPSVSAILFQFNTMREVELDIKDYFFHISNERINSIEDYVSSIESKNFDTETQTWLPFNSRIIMNAEKYDYIFRSEKKRVSAWLNNLSKLKFKKYGYACIELDSPLKTIITDNFLNEYSKDIHFIREYAIQCLYEGDSILDNLLKKYIGEDVIIPFDIEDRKKKFPLAFQELEPYMKKYLKKDAKKL